MVEKHRTYQICVCICLAIIVLFCIMPFVLLLTSSISSDRSLIRYGYSYFPKEFSLESYAYLWKNSDKILRAYGLSILTTAVGTTLNVLLTILMAYPLSRPEIKGRKLVAFYVFFTMLFNGGLIPQYLVWTQMFHIRDTFAAYILPNLLLSPFYVIMMRSYLTANIHPSLIEAARIDGIGEFSILRYIIIPLSKPMIATVALMNGITYWNNWQNGFYYIKDSSKLTIQGLLNEILYEAQYLAQYGGSEAAQIAQSIPSVGIRMAIAVIGVLPIFIIYPFIQKYLIKGITIGSVKG